MGSLAKYVNVNPHLAGVVYRGRCTLYELKTVYSLEDVYWMEEVDYIPELNQRRYNERQARIAEMRKMLR